MRTVIVERATRALMALDPPMRDGVPLLVEGVDCEAVQISDEDSALIGQGNARYSVDTAGRLVVTPVAVEPVVDPDAEQAELDAGIASATTLAALKAALLGSRGGRVKARPAA